MEKINNFKSTNRNKIIKDAFLLIGPIALSIDLGNPIFMVLSAFSILPILNGIQIKKALKNSFLGNTLDFEVDKGYYKNFNKGLFKYIDNSETEIEKKYKIIFSLLWMSEERITIENTTNKYSEKKDFTKYKKYLNMINVNEGSDYESYRRKLLYSDMFLNIDNEELEVAKKVYDDFKSLGLLGKTIYNLNSPIFELLLKVQDYKLSDKDIFVITNPEEVEKINENEGFNMIKTFSDDFKDNPNAMKILSQIICNEKNKDNLDGLLEFFQNSNKYNGYDEAIFSINAIKNKGLLEEALSTNKTKPLTIVKL